MNSNYCKACAKCCHGLYVYISHKEAELISQTTGMRIEDFINTTLPEKHQRAGFYIIRHAENGDCVFLERQDEDYHCNIYSDRPNICRNFPSSQTETMVCSQLRFENEMHRYIKKN
jgi:Fe-S-cluster containining protein